MCPHCHHQLGWRDLVPVLSWVALRGKCRYCRASISALYPATELFTALLFVLVTYYLDVGTSTAASVESVFWYVSTVCLVALMLYDLRWKILPNQLTFFLIGWATLVRLTQWALFGSGALLLDALLGGVVLFGLFATTFYLSRGKWLGGGDVKLAAFMGIALGWQLGLLALMFASWIGMLVVIAAALKNKLRLVRGQQIAFGPLLIIGTYLALFYGQAAIDWYRTFLYV